MLGLLIIVTTIGKTYMPEWALALSVLTILVCVIYNTLILYTKEKSFFEEKLRTLNSNIEKSKDELFKQQNDQITELTNLIIDKCNSLQQLVSNSIDSLNKESAKRTTSVMDQLVAQTAEIEKKFKNEAEIINMLSETTKSLSSQILSKIASDSDKIEKNIMTDIQLTSKKLRQIVENKQEIITEHILENSKVLTESIEKGVVDISNIIIDGLKKTQLVVKESNDSLLYTAKEHHDGLNSLIETVSNKNDALNQTLETSVSMLSNKLDDTKGQACEIIKTMDVINQQNLSLQEDVSSCNELVANTTESIKSSISRDKADMIEQIQQSADNVSRNVDGYVANAVKLLTMSMVEAKEAYNNTGLVLLNTTTEQAGEIKQIIKDVEVHCTNLIQKLENTQNLFSHSFEKLNENITTSTNDVKINVLSETAKNTKSISDVITGRVLKISQSIDNVSKISNDNVEIIVKSIKEGKTSLSNKVDSLEKQTMVLSTDLKVMNEVDSKIKDSLKSIQEQCSSMQRGLTGVQIQSNNVEKTLNSFVSKNTNDKIIEAIRRLIDNLHKELKSNVSDINEELLETQIKQESTNDQLNKLQTLLRNISKDIASPLSLEKPIPKQPEEKKKLTPVLSTPSKQESNPNRTETIVDSQTNNIVLNQFVGGKLAKSTMKDVKGHLLYELEYKNGQIARSRNYDIKGNMNIEQTFYDNGQVHFRNEITENGKITTEFDRNGNKK